MAISTPEESSIRVLHVDDDPAFAEMVAAHLERFDDRITVHVEQRPRTGLDILDEEPVDCIVSDYQMPGMDGVDFLRAVRQEYPNLPFILFTGEGSETVAAEATSAGVTSYLKKEGTNTIELLCTHVQEAVRRSRAERTATLATDRLHRMFEHVDGFYAVDPDWTVTYWNQQMADRTGTSPAEVVGECLWDVHGVATKPEVRDRLETVRRDRTTAEFEVYVDASERWLELHAYSVPEGVFVQSRDVTDRKEGLQELERRNQRLESVARTLSHDLKNPLQLAEGRLDLARETGELDHLEDVTRAHNRMQNLINELLRLAREEEMELDWTPLRTVIDEAWAFTDTRDADLVVAFDDVSVFADDGQIQRVFENLFENAVEHGNASTVRVEVPVDDSRIVVEDDGTGLRANDVDRIFESGFSTDGTGYGLAIVEQIAQEHDWRVSVTDSDGNGARFELSNVELARE